MENIFTNIIKWYVYQNESPDLPDTCDTYLWNTFRNSRLELILYEFYKHQSITLSNEQELYANNIKSLFQHYYKESEKFVSLMHKHAVPFYFIKGFATCSLYREPWHRQFSDIDILVSRSYSETLESILKKQSYEIAEEHTNSTLFRCTEGLFWDINYVPILCTQTEIFNGRIFPKNEYHILYIIQIIPHDIYVKTALYDCGETLPLDRAIDLLLLLKHSDIRLIYTLCNEAKCIKKAAHIINLLAGVFDDLKPISKVFDSKLD